MTDSEYRRRLATETARVAEELELAELSALDILVRLKDHISVDQVELRNAAHRLATLRTLLDGLKHEAGEGGGL